MKHQGLCIYMNVYMYVCAHAMYMYMNMRMHMRIGEALLLGESAEAEATKEELGLTCAAAEEACRHLMIQGTYSNTPQGIVSSCA